MFSGVYGNVMGMFMGMFKGVTVFYTDGVSSLYCEILLLICSALLNNAQFFYTLEGTVNGFIF